MAKRSLLMIIAGVILLFAFAGVAGPATADVRAPASTGPVDLSARLLNTSDLPPGFQPYKPMNGPLNAQRAGKLGGTLFAQAADSVHGWIGYWVSGITGQQVIEYVIDAGTSHGAGDARAGFVSSMSARGMPRQQLTTQLAVYRSSLPVNGSPYTVLATPLARGPFFFVLEVLFPAQSQSAGDSLMVNLVAAQDRKVPANTPDTGTSLSGLQADPYNAAGYAIGALLGYLAIVSGIAYLRNPLRRGRRGEQSGYPPVPPDGRRVLDVSEHARKYRNSARIRMLVQFVGLSLIACGADPYLVPNWYLFVLIGAAVTWAGGRFIRPTGLAPRDRNILSGGRRVRVTVLMALAFLLIAVGALALIAAALQNSEPAVVQAVDAASSGSTTSTQAEAYLWFGLILMGAAAVLARLARRFAAVDARHVMQRDTRPPVLVLRSFGDDSLKLWTATFGRPSLLERFTPRRFDAFEEVIARHLLAAGPVIAVNPPGTRLAPLGAARETLDMADWQGTVSEWMGRSAAIVFIMPPEKVTSGLTWELQQVSVNQHWAKTLIIVPPVRVTLLHARWQEFLAAWGMVWPFTSPLPATPSPLVLAFRYDMWAAITADRRDEWTYSAAIEAALVGLPVPAATVPGEPDPLGGYAG